MTPHQIRSIHYYRQLWYARPPLADIQKINKLYEKAARLGLTVDHIIPINHPYVSGLHVFENLNLMIIILINYRYSFTPRRAG